MKRFSSDPLRDVLVAGFVLEIVLIIGIVIVMKYADLIDTWKW